VNGEFRLQAHLRHNLRLWERGGGCVLQQLHRNTGIGEGVMVMLQMVTAGRCDGHGCRNVTALAFRGRLFTSSGQVSRVPRGDEEAITPTPDCGLRPCQGLIALRACRPFGAWFAGITDL